MKIVLITPEGKEKTTEYLSSGLADDGIYGWVEDVLGKRNAPFARIRAYRGSELVHDAELEIRG